MSKYRKKPVEIEAFQYDGYFKTQDGVPMWIVYAMNVEGWVKFKEGGELYIDTLEGEMHVSVGDYIIKGISNELYPCKPDIFEKSYELVEANKDTGIDMGHGYNIPGKKSPEPTTLTPTPLQSQDFSQINLSFRGHINTPEPETKSVPIGTEKSDPWEHTLNPEKLPTEAMMDGFNSTFDIDQLDDPKEEPVIEMPVEFDKWYQGIKERYAREESYKALAIANINKIGFGYLLEDENKNTVETGEVGKYQDLCAYVTSHKELCTKAILYGYVVKKSLYAIKDRQGDWLNKYEITSRNASGTTFWTSHKKDILTFDEKERAIAISKVVGGEVVEL